MKISFFVLVAILLKTSLSNLTAEQILAQVLIERGASDEEAKIVAKDYCKVANVQVDKIIEEFELNDFSQYWKYWKINLFKDLIRADLSKLDEDFLMSTLKYELFKEISQGYQSKTKKELNKDISLKCADKQRNSFYI